MSRVSPVLRGIPSLQPLAPFAPAAFIVVLQLVVFPMEVGAWSLGLVTGLLTALLALGLALVYRANRILNFAQSDLGTVPTTLAVGLITVTGLPYLIGVTVGLAAALVLGAVVELAIVRRFARAPRLLLTVATIGVSQLLIVCGVLLPRLWDQEIFADRRIPDPFGARIELGSQTFGGSEIVAVVLAPLLLVALAMFLRGTDIGVAVRASAESSDRAALLGIPVRRLQTLVWAVAATMSFVGVFLHASIFGVGGAAALSPQVLVFALGALVLGRLEHLPAITASAVALRILGQGVDANNPSSPGRAYVVLAAVVLVALVVRRSSTRRRDRDASESWSAAAEVRPVPIELRNLGVVRLARIGIHQAGPNLGPETFRDGMFAYPPSGDSPTQPQISFGEHGFHAQPDYLAVDDMTEIWWDAEAKGKDEQGEEGTGMVRYSEGGKRFLPGTMPKAPPKAFQEEGSVTIYDEPPADEAPPTYPSPAGGG